jgi:hypothetical protein
VTARPVHTHTHIGDNTREAQVLRMGEALRRWWRRRRDLKNLHRRDPFLYK